MENNNVQGTNLFPWKRGLLASLGVMAIVFILFASGAVVTELGFGIISAVLGDGFVALIKANRMLVVSSVGFLGYIVGSWMAVTFLKRMCETNSAITAVRGRWSDMQGKIGKTIMWAIIGFVVLHIFDVLYMLLPVPTPKVPAGEMAATMSGLALFVFALGASFLGPIYEEIICRGFVFNMLRSSFSQRCAGGVATVLAMIISAAFFAAFHLTLTAFIPLFVFGLIAAEVYRRTGNIYAPMLMHFFNNALVSVIMIAGSMS